MDSDPEDSDSVVKDLGLNIYLPAVAIVRFFYYYFTLNIDFEWESIFTFIYIHLFILRLDEVDSYWMVMERHLLMIVNEWCQSFEDRIVMICYSVKLQKAHHFVTYSCNSTLMLVFVNQIRRM